jgi:lipopolysaccharide transport system ATP-binding protein
MSTVKVEGLFKKFSSKLSDSVRSGIKEIVQSQKQRSDDSLSNSEFWALDNISFELDQGDALGILGANGSGKTTLLRVLNGTYKPTKGRFEMKEPIGSLIAAGAGFSPTLTGRENVFLSASLLGLSMKEIEKKYDSIVEFSELGDFLEMPLSHYSSGMSVRLAFAVATSVIPEVLLIDEVLAVGDIGFQRKCFARIGDLKKAGTTFLIVSHSTESTWELCNKGLFMDAGKSEGIEDVKNVIAKYVNKTISKQNPDKNIDFESQSSNNIKIKQISIFGNRGPEHVILFKENLTLHISFETKVKINACYFRINISNDKYRPIATSDTSLHQGGQQDLDIGDHELRLDLSEVNLKPGRYFLDLGLNNANGGPHLGLFKDALQFEILASPENPIYDYGMQALIDLPSKVMFFE